MKIGDQVAVLDDALEGVITNIKGDEVTLEDKDGFPMTYHKKELVLMEKQQNLLKKLDVTLSEILKEKQSEKPHHTQRTPPKKRSAPAMVVDLHVYKLVASEKNMSAYDKLNLQLDTARHKLEFAIKKRIQKIVFIHGVGEGVLKAELETLFRRYHEVKFYDADFRTYGLGATEVYVYQNV